MSGRFEIKLAVLFLVMAALTVVCGMKIEQYETAGSDLLTGQWRFHAGETGVAEKKGAKLHLVSPDGKSVSIRQKLDSFPPGEVVRLSGDLRCEKVQAGERVWNHARLLLVQRDEQGARIEGAHVAASLTGTVGWKHYKKYFTIGSDTKSLEVIAQLSRCSGKFQLKNIHLHPVAQTTAYTGAKRGVLAGWGLFAVFLLGSVLYRGRRKIVLQVLLTAVFAAILAGAVMPADMKARVSDRIEHRVVAVVDILQPVVSGHIAGIGHFAFFLVFGAFLAQVPGQRPWLAALGYVLMAAGGSEMAQAFIDGRSPFPTDFLIDAAGGLTGIFAVAAWVYPYGDKPGCGFFDFRG